MAASSSEGGARVANGARRGAARPSGDPGCPLLITLRRRLTAVLIAAALVPVLAGAVIAGLAGPLTPALIGLLGAAAAGSLVAAGMVWAVTRQLADLATSRDQLRDQVRDQLRVLGEALSGTHDLARIREVVLGTARSALGARSGAVLVAPVGSVDLVGIADGSPLRVPLGSGLLGAVALSGQARRGTFGPQGPRLAPGEPPAEPPGEPRGVSYLAVPLRRPGSVRGVLALYDRLGGQEFDDADVAALRTLADRAAIAMENVLAHEEAQRLSYTDPLTGLYNYRMLSESMRREVERANRFGHQLAVLVLDLDRFKEVNDSHGHAAGDAVLTEFARRLRDEIREVDLAFRQGGEEFVLLLPETDATGGATVARRLCDAVRATPMLVPRSFQAASAVTPGGGPTLPGARRAGLARRVPVTVSVGVAVFPEHGATGAAVLQAADEALYAAKADGRDTCRVAASRTEVVATTAGGGASGGPHPPRQSRGR
jgi:two-component system, cell cycle response regulator